MPAGSWVDGETAPPLYPPRRGQSVGRFIVIEQIGVGGMSSVFSAFDTVLDRRIALKFLPGPQRQSWLKEASLMAKLQHPNVVTVYAVGELGGTPYIAMELVEGHTLAGWAATQPRSTADKLRVMAAAARGLAAAHAAGIVHRDVKPQNILVAADRVLVTDFGISVRMEDGVGGDVVGTPSYMAPEQFEGETIDRRTDVFGFCATLYELLYGAGPFPGTSIAEVRARILTGQVETPPAQAKVPGQLHRLVTSGLAVDPGQRPQDLNDLAALLVRAQPSSRRRVAAVIAGVGVLVAAFWGGGYLRAAPERQCRVGVAAIDQILSVEKSDRLRTHFAATGQAGLWDATRRGLEAFAARWRAMYQGACTAMHVERRQSRAVFDVRMDCLRSRRIELAALVQALGEAAPSKLIEGPSAASRLSSVSTCDGSGVADPLPSAPSLRPRREVVEGLIARALSEGLLADPKQAAAIAEQAVAKARAVGYQPLLAQALMRAALLTLEVGKGEGDESGSDGALGRAVTLLEESTLVAERGHADDRRAAALRALVMVSVQRGNRREAEIYAQRASAAINGLGDPPEERAAYLLDEGWRKRTFGLGDGRAEFNRSLELRQRALPANHPDLVASWAAVCGAERDEAASRACHAKALAVAQAAWGAGHPEVAHIHASLAGALAQHPGTRAEACDLFRKALAIEDAAGVDPAKPSHLATQTDLARCLRESGKLADAKAIYQELLVKAARPSPHRARVHQAYGVFLAELGNWQQGARYGKLALAERRQIHGACDDLVVESVNSLSIDLLHLQQPRQAARELDQTFAACERSGARPARLAVLLNQRGFVLQGWFRRYDEALAMHERALALVEEQGPEASRSSAHHGMGLALQRLGRMNEAAAHMTRAAGFDRNVAAWDPVLLKKQ
jgi:tetratricopeptide (TPR) repeat protein